jgi:hypothetical protein
MAGIGVVGQLESLVGRVKGPREFLGTFRVYVPPGSAEYAPYIGVALTSLAAVYVGYLYLQSWREAAVELDPATPFSAAPEPHPMS